MQQRPGLNIVNRYQLPYEDTPFQPDVVVKDFHELADRLG
jgi:hypothetical protein